MNSNRASVKSFEPRVLVSGSRAGRWSAEGRTVDETLCTSVESWVYAFNGDYVGQRAIAKEDVRHHDIVIMNMNRPLQPLVSLALDRPSSTKWVSLVEGSADDYLRPQRDLKALLDVSDLVNVINRHSLPVFRSLTRSRVEYVGVPYPVDGVKKFMVPVEARNRRIFVCTPLLTRWNDYLAAREIGLPYYGTEKLRMIGPRRRSFLPGLIRRPSAFWKSQERIREARALYEDDSLEIMPFTEDMTKYLTQNAGSYLWVDLDSRYTWARYVLDAAALCMPIITTSSTYHGEIFFPQTTVAHAVDIDRAIEIGKRLSTDRDFYEHVALYPADKMDFLKAEPMTRTLLGALDLL
jgi:hypothetical protein